MINYVLINKVPCVKADILISRVPRRSQMNVYRVIIDNESKIEYVCDDSFFKDERYSSEKYSGTGSIMTPIDLFYDEAKPKTIELNASTIIYLDGAHFSPDSPAVLHTLKVMVNMTHVYSPIITMDLSWALHDNGSLMPYPVRKRRKGDST